MDPAGEDTGAAEARRAKEYDAFVSYSHAADGELAPAIQQGLQRFAKAWNQRRALDVFRDETGLAVNPDLWGSICTAMDGAKWFVLLCSPGAAKSEWVGKEIERWVAKEGAERILPVVTEGTFHWDTVAGDIDLARSTAAHPALSGVFAAEPRHIDMSWARAETDLSLKNARFRDQIAEIAAPMHGTTKDELEGTDVRQQRRTQRLARGAVAALAILAVLAMGSAAAAVGNAREAADQRDEAERQREEAVVQARMATSQRLADLSTTAEPTLQALLAAQAHRMASTPQATGAMVQALLTGAQGIEGRLTGHADVVSSVNYSADGEHVVSVDGTGAVRVFTADGSPVGGPFDVDGRAAAFAGNDVVVAATREGTVFLSVGDDEPGQTVDVGDATSVAPLGPDAVVVGLESGGVATLDASGEITATLDDVHDEPVRFVGSSSSGEVVVSHARRIDRLEGFTGGGSVAVHEGTDLSVSGRWVSEGPVLALSPDGSSVTVAPGSAEPGTLVRIANAASGENRESVSTIGVYIPRAASFLPDGRSLVVATTGGADGAPGLAFLAPIGDVTNEQLLPEQMDLATAVAVAPNGQQAVIGGSESDLPIVALGGDGFGGPLDLAGGAEPAVPLSVADDPGLLLVRTEQGLGVASLADETVTPVVGAGTQGALSPDGYRLLTDSGLVSVPDGSPIGDEELLPPLFDPPPVVSADGRRMAYVVAPGLDVAVIDLEDGSTVTTGPAPARLCGVDGPCLRPSNVLALSPDGSRLALRTPAAGQVDDAPGIVWVVDVDDTWEPTAQINALGEGGMSFGDDGEKLLVQSGSTVDALDSSDFERPGAELTTNAAGRWVQSGSSFVAVDRCGVVLVDPVSLRTVAEIPVDVQFVEGGCLADELDAVWIDEGAALLTTVDTCDGGACPVQRWDLNPAQMADTLCQRAGRNFTQAEWDQFLPGFDYEVTCEQWPSGGGETAPPTSTMSSSSPSSTTPTTPPTTAVDPTTTEAAVPPSSEGPGTVCGQVAGSPSAPTFDVIIGSGSVTCPEAMSIATTYFTDPDLVHEGSGGFATVDGFFCGFGGGAGAEGSCEREDPSATFQFVRSAG
jgi:TIR domain